MLTPKNSRSLGESPRHKAPARVPLDDEEQLGEAMIQTVKQMSPRKKTGDPA